MLFTELLSSAFKLYIIYQSILNLGIIKGILAIYFLFVAYRFFLRKVFNLVYTGFDASLIGFKSREQYNVCLVLSFDKFDEEKMKHEFIERAIKKVPRLHSKIVNRFCNYYWEEVEIEHAIKKIKSTNIPGKDDLVNYIDKEINIPLLLLNEIPFEIHFIKYENSNGGAIFLKIDHVVSDGLGFVSLLCLLVDDTNADVFPKVMQMKQYSMINEFIDIVFFPYYFLVTMFWFALLRYEKSEFKVFSNYFNRGITKFAYSPWYSTKCIHSMRKKLKVGFNDGALAILLKSMKYVFTHNTSMNLVIPCGKTGIPKSISELELRNQSHGVLLNFPLIEHIEDVKQINKILLPEIINSGKTSVASHIIKIWGEVLPLAMINLMGNLLVWKTDLIVTNVPGPVKAVKFADCELTDFFPVVSVGRVNGFVTIASYNNKFRYVISYDKTVESDPCELVKSIDRTVEETEKKYND